MAALYRDETYFRNPEFSTQRNGSYHGYRNYLADLPHIFEKFNAVVGRIEAEIGRGTLLDVGAGPGFLLTVARERGWDVCGLDLNPWAADHARREFGVEVRTQTLEEAAFEPAQFDAITMMDLLEHVADPASLLAKAASILREDGVLVILTPDAGSPVSRLLGSRWPEVQRVPEHLVLFSVEGLSQLLEDHGFETFAQHSVGKTSNLTTLLADVAPALPRPVRRAGLAVSRTRLGRYTFNFDPHTKFCLYARRIRWTERGAAGAMTDYR